MPALPNMTVLKRTDCSAGRWDLQLYPVGRGNDINPNNGVRHLSLLIKYISGRDSRLAIKSQLRNN